MLTFGFCGFRESENRDEFFLTIEGSSMAPAIAAGSTVKVSKDADVVRGSVVVYRYPLDPQRTFIGRVVALPIDRVEVVDGKLLVNGSTHDEIGFPLSYSIAQVAMRENEFFILGDNRNDSHDSHVFGPVWEGYVLGVVAE